MRALAFGIATVLALAACSEKKALPTARGSALADAADQVMFGAKFTLTSQGVSRARLIADTAYFFDDNTRAELAKVNTTFFTMNGVKDAVLTSRRGTYNTRLATMVARENVVVLSEDGRRLETSELIYNENRNEISSDSAFVLTEPNRRLEGIGFRSDPNMNNIQILRGASGVLRNMSTAPSQPAVPENGAATNPVARPTPVPPPTPGAGPGTSTTPQRLR